MKLAAALGVLALASAAAAEPKPKKAAQVVVTFDPDNGSLKYESGPAIDPRTDDLARYFEAGYVIVALAHPAGQADRVTASLVKGTKAGAFVEFDPDNGAIKETVGKDNGDSLDDWLAKGWVVRALVDTGKPGHMGAALEK